MKALQARREEAVGPLVDVLAKRKDLMEKLAALDAEYGKAYVDAEVAGWTSAELAELGADEPAKRPRGRPKRSREAVKKPAAKSPHAASESGSPVSGLPVQGGAAAASASSPGGAVSP